MLWYLDYCVNFLNVLIIGLQQLCFLQFDDMLGLPVFNHYGNAASNASQPQTPQPCWCEPNAYGYEPYCDEFDLLTSMRRLVM